MNISRIYLIIKKGSNNNILIYSIHDKIWNDISTTKKSNTNREELRSPGRSRIIIVLNIKKIINPIQESNIGNNLYNAVYTKLKTTAMWIYQ